MPAPATLETPRTLASTASVQEGQGVAHTKRRTSGTAATPAETVRQRLARLRRERGLTQVERGGEKREGKIKTQVTCTASPRRDRGTRESRRTEVSHLKRRRDQASRDCAI